MYRIHFDHKQARFVIQILWLGMFWRTVWTVNQGAPEAVDRYELSFDDYDSACDWVKKVGLNKTLVERLERDAYHNQLVTR